MTLLITSKYLEKYKIPLYLLFKGLRLYGLTINIAKCKFGKSKLCYLRYLATAKGLSLNPQCAEGTRNFKLQENMIDDLFRILLK